MSSTRIHLARARAHDGPPDGPCARHRQAPRCATCLAYDQAPWAGASREDLEALEAALTHRSFARGDTLFVQGARCAAVVCIQQGRVALRIQDGGGNGALVGLGREGDILGLPALLGPDRYTVSAEALTETQACLIDARAARALLDRSAALRQALVGRMAAELNELRTRQLLARLPSVRRRLLAVLLELRGPFGTAAPDGTLTVELPISRRDLASMVGATPETLSRAITELTREGLAQVQGRVVTIPDLDRVLDEVEGGS